MISSFQHLSNKSEYNLESQDVFFFFLRGLYSDEGKNVQETARLKPLKTLEPRHDKTCLREFRMRRLICAFVVRIWHKTHFLMARLIILLNVLPSPDFRWTYLLVLAHLQRVLQKLKTETHLPITRMRNRDQYRMSIRAASGLALEESKMHTFSRI